MFQLEITNIHDAFPDFCLFAGVCRMFSSIFSAKDIQSGGPQVFLYSSAATYFPFSLASDFGAYHLWSYFREHIISSNFGAYISPWILAWSMRTSNIDPCTTPMTIPVINCSSGTSKALGRRPLDFLNFVNASAVTRPRAVTRLRLMSCGGFLCGFIGDYDGQYVRLMWWFYMVLYGFLHGASNNMVNHRASNTPIWWLLKSVWGPTVILQLINHL